MVNSDYSYAIKYISYRYLFWLLRPWLGLVSQSFSYSSDVDYKLHNSINNIYVF